MRRLLLLGTAMVMSVTVADLVQAQQCCIYERDGSQLMLQTCTQPSNSIQCAQQAFNYDSGDGALGENGMGLFSSSPAMCGNPSCVVNISLPVELTSFTASTTAPGEVALSWETASEVNNAGFHVEWTVDGNDFAELAYVDGRGTTDEPSSYSYRVSDLDAGVHTFRLKQVDFDGTFEYTHEVEATVELPDAFVLEAPYPNPFNPTTQVRFGVSVDTEVRIELFDAAGKRVQVLYEGVPESGSMQSVSIDGSNLTSGTYMVKMTASDFQTSRPVTLLK